MTSASGDETDPDLDMVRFVLDRAAALTLVGGDGLALTRSADPVEFLVAEAMEGRLRELRALERRALAREIIRTLAEAMK